MGIVWLRRPLSAAIAITVLQKLYFDARCTLIYTRKPVSKAGMNAMQFITSRNMIEWASQNARRTHEETWNTKSSSKCFLQMLRIHAVFIGIYLEPNITYKLAYSMNWPLASWPIGSGGSSLKCLASLTCYCACDFSEGYASRNAWLTHVHKCCSVSVPIISWECSRVCAVRWWPRHFGMFIVKHLRGFRFIVTYHSSVQPCIVLRCPFLKVFCYLLNNRANVIAFTLLFSSCTWRLACMYHAEQYTAPHLVNTEMRCENFTRLVVMSNSEQTQNTRKGSSVSSANWTDCGHATKCFTT